MKSIAVGAVLSKLLALGSIALLAACATKGAPFAAPSTDPAGDTDESPSAVADASVRASDAAQAHPAKRDAGQTAQRDAQAPAHDTLDGAANQISDANAAPVDAATKTDASAPALADDAGVAASARVPVFKTTRCIDPSKLTPGNELNYPCDGIDVWVVVPSQCTKRACGVIFNIHGGGMSDHATMDQATNMIALGTQADYIVVHPHKGTWDVGNDRTAVFGFLQQIIEAFDVDKKRVHSTGYSQGGQLSWALGCEHADVVASIAPAEEINRVTDCWKTSKLPTRELPVLFAYGKQDSIGGGYDAAKQLVSQYVAAYAMKGPDTIAGADGSTYWRQRWTSPAGNVLEFISQNYTSTGVLGVLAGHCLPMASGTTFVSCSLPVDYDWGAEAVKFFQAHPMP